MMDLTKNKKYIYKGVSIRDWKNVQNRVNLSECVQEAESRKALTRELEGNI